MKRFINEYKEIIDLIFGYFELWTHQSILKKKKEISNIQTGQYGIEMQSNAFGCLIFNCQFSILTCLWSLWLSLLQFDIKLKSHCFRWK